MGKLVNLEMLIDYLEGEADPRSRSKLNLLLKHSIHDRVVLDNLRRLRKLVANSDRTADIDPLLRNERYLNRLHDSIMTTIENSQNVEKTSTRITLKQSDR